jgi:MYXO-CTERM domain-containing protein
MLFRSSPLFLALLGFVLAGSGSAGAVSLQDLIDGDTIEVEGLLFDSFNYSEVGDGPAAADINVLVTHDDDGNPGIRFGGGFADLAGGGDTSIIIGYRVSVVDGADILITDAHLTGNPNVFGEGASFSVVDQFLSGTDCGGSQCTLEIFDNNDGNPQLVDEVVFPGVSSITVRKTIELHAEENTVAAISFIDQTYSSEPTPEPTAMGLGGLALALIAARRRR